MSKAYNRTVYRVNKQLEVVCWAEGTQYGFRHLAQLVDNGRAILQTKACYYNRTWERYDFESVIHNLIDKSDIRNKVATKKKIDNKALGVIEDKFKTISSIMAIGDIFTETKTEANDWKVRMLKAGVPEGALSLPEDWEQLSEEEKETRLNKVIEQFAS